MKLVNLQNNLVFVYKENIASFLKTEPIELQIAEIYSEKTPKPIISKFPDQVIIFVPEIQSSIIASGVTLAITDQTIGEFTKKDSKSLLQVGNSIAKDILKKPIIYYGYNFSYTLEEIEIEEAKKRIKEYFFKAEGFLPADKTLIYNMPTYSFSDEKYNVTIKFDYQYKDIARTEAIISVHANLHFVGDIKGLPGLSQEYQESEAYVSQHIQSIFG